MRRIDADGVIGEIKRNKLLAREPATERCMEIIENATTYAEPPRKCLVGIWIPVEDRLPDISEAEKNDEEFLVQSDTGERFTCKFNSMANGYDNPLWCCNVHIVAWMPLPEPYKPEN